jgi:hypothetical protein
MRYSVLGSRANRMLGQSGLGKLTLGVGSDGEEGGGEGKLGEHDSSVKVIQERIKEASELEREGEREMGEGERESWESSRFPFSRFGQLFPILSPLANFTTSPCLVAFFASARSHLVSPYLQLGFAFQTPLRSSSPPSSLASLSLNPQDCSTEPLRSSMLHLPLKLHTTPCRSRLLLLLALFHPSFHAPATFFESRSDRTRALQLVSVSLQLACTA